MWWWILVALTASLIAAMSVPVDLWFEVQRKEDWHGAMRVGWMFGLVSFPVRGGEPAKPSPKRKRRAKRSSRIGSRIFRRLRQPAFQRQLFRLVRRTLRAVRPRDLHLRLRIGFADPAETGMLWAVLGSLLPFVPSRWRAGLDVAPEYWEETFDLESSGRVRLIPVQLLCLALGFALAPVTLRALFAQGGRV